MSDNKFKSEVRRIIFEADTPLGKLFDLLLFIIIIFSVVIVMLNSVESINYKWGDVFLDLEWIITAIFTIEYILRIYSARKPLSYVFSFYGIIDFLSIIPTYLSIIITGTHFLLVIRLLRLLRIFRVFKLARYVNASNTLLVALKSSKRKIIVFLEAVLIIVVITGSLMYLVEGPETGFSSIPKSIYWSIVTITTVGYGDIAPQTVLGQTIASILMIIGFAIIAVPTSIIGGEIIKSELSTSSKKKMCHSCNKPNTQPDVKYCGFCGKVLDDENKS